MKHKFGKKSYLKENTSKWYIQKNASSSAENFRKDNRILCKKTQNIVSLWAEYHENWQSKPQH